MSYGPWATELGAQLLGLRFRKLSKLEACSLALGPSGLTLAACTFWPVAMGLGPRFVDLIYFSVLDM